MTLGSLVFLASVLTIALMATFFIVCRRYEEGTFGNLFLGLLIIACAVVIWDALDGTFVPPEPIYCLMVLCFAVFMFRHAWRFAMFHWHGKFGWRAPADMRGRAAEQ